MKESPFYDELVAEGVRESVKQALEVRFGAEVTQDFRAELDGITERGRLAELLTEAIRCRRVSDFRRALKRSVVQH